MRLHSEISENSKGKKALYSSRIHVLSVEIWQLSNVCTAFFHSMAAAVQGSMPQVHLDVAEFDSMNYTFLTDAMNIFPWILRVLKIKFRMVFLRFFHSQAVGISFLTYEGKLHEKSKLYIFIQPYSGFFSIYSAQPRDFNARLKKQAYQMLDIFNDTRSLPHTFTHTVDNIMYQGSEQPRDFNARLEKKTFM